MDFQKMQAAYKELINNEARIPITINDDKKYRDTLEQCCEKLLEKIECFLSVDEYELIKDFSQKLIEVVNLYYSGRTQEAQKIVTDIVNEIRDNDVQQKVWFSNLYDNFCYSTNMKNVFFRARLGDSNESFTSKRMMMLPHDCRTKAKTGRFNIAGVTSLYLANSSYCCWMEKGRPADNLFNVSKFELKDNFYVLNLANTDVLENFAFTNVGEVLASLKMLILRMAVYFRVEEKDRSFKSEYVISNLLTSACIEAGVDGIAYYSTKSECLEANRRIAVNIVIFDNPQKEINNCFVVSNAINYSLFKHINASQDIIKEHSDSMKIYENGLIIEYSFTDFYFFDKYLFKHV